jgi:hypothetical protein
MTTTRSAIWLTSARSCVMNSTAMRRRACNAAIRSRICFCTVTSSALVGSSAIRSFGSQATAMAIIARCCSPPESWKG